MGHGSPSVTHPPASPERLAMAGGQINTDFFNRRDRKGREGQISVCRSRKNMSK